MSSAQSKKRSRRRRRSSKTRPVRRQSGDLREDLHRYNISLAEYDHAGEMAQREEIDPRGRQTRFEERSRRNRRLLHFLQFVVLLSILAGLLAWLLYSSALYL